ncbi:hypothetical protein HPB48_019479 [Haemaphysalis longicornis]|uniref:Uncharacterized protein n=1 Tax=Haemaphysalis longicornis TaxID=44386 RepID=A0A9J6FK19_HAELO|nr:hypothetical protein HPB48_019479 [Haemaphysalis longicornis]
MYVGFCARWSEITLRTEMLQRAFGDVVEAPVADVDSHAVYLAKGICKPQRRHVGATPTGVDTGRTTTSSGSSSSSKYCVWNCIRRRLASFAAKVSAANKSAIVVKGPHEKHSNEERIADEKVLRMLKQLLNTMRKLIAGLKSQSAKTVVQVLDALESLIEALQ